MVTNHPLNEVLQQIALEQLADQIDELKHQQGLNQQTLEAIVEMLEQPDHAGLNEQQRLGAWNLINGRPDRSEWQALPKHMRTLTLKETIADVLWEEGIPARPNSRFESTDRNGGPPRTI